MTKPRSEASEFSPARFVFSEAARTSSSTFASVRWSRRRVFYVLGGRRSPSLARAEWDEARRATYLLRDVEVPFSFDEKVLPLARPGEAHPDDFDLAASILRTPGTELAVASLMLGEPLPELPGDSSEWTSLGFDVCEAVGYSGLMNCGYEAELRDGLARTWAPRLDGHHLLQTLEDADAFRELSDQRVREHAPFLVYRDRARIRLQSRHLERHHEVLRDGPGRGGVASAARCQKPE
jgi:hypothetical protein